MMGLNKTLLLWTTCLCLGVIVGVAEADNVALNKPVTMSAQHPTGYWSYATDGNTNGQWAVGGCASTGEGLTDPWMIVDLLDNYTVGALTIYNRVDADLGERLYNFSVLFGYTFPPPEIHFYSGTFPDVDTILFDQTYYGRYLGLRMLGTGKSITICELELYEPENGNWSAWGDFSDCSATCGSSSRSRTRTCDDPAPLYNGICVGDGIETETCDVDPCPVDGGWSDFSDWSTCTQSCGTGVSFRTRTCTNPPPSWGGADCFGCCTDIDTCNTQDCPDSCAAILDRPAENCNEVRIQNPDAPSGEYYITLPSGDVVPVYCDFMAKHGYMFFSKTALSALTTIEGLYDIFDHAVIRTFYDNGEQHEVEVAQLSMYRERFPLSVQLSAHTGYESPINWNLQPYLLLGFLPLDHTLQESDINRIMSIQGYMAGGEDVTIRNSETHDNYMAFFRNDGELSDGVPSRCCETMNVKAWFMNAQPVPESRYLSQDYFMSYEMNMGKGSGGYFMSTHGIKHGIQGAALGLGFEYVDCEH